MKLVRNELGQLRLQLVRNNVTWSIRYCSSVRLFEATPNKNVEGCSPDSGALAHNIKWFIDNL